MKRQKIAPIFENVTKKRKEENEELIDNTSPRERKIIAWNVAGAKAWFKKNGVSILEKEDADIIFLGETKCEELPPLKTTLKGYSCYLVPSVKKGYAGVALMSKEKPLMIIKGIGDDRFDNEGRLIIAEFPTFYFIGAYVPNSGRGLVNLEKRGIWEELMKNKIKELDSKKPVVYGGDLNVAHQEIDLANPKSNANKTPGFTDQERNNMTKMLEECSLEDTFRHIHGQKVSYTFWSYMGGARNKNIGWRLDYFLTSQRITNNVKKSDVLEDIHRCSDHAPILLVLNI